MLNAITAHVDEKKAEADASAGGDA